MRVQMTGTLSRASKRGAVVVAAVLSVLACLALAVFFVALRNYSALDRAIKDGDIEAVEQILGRHPERLERRNKSQLTPLLEAAWEGQVDVLTALIQRGADVNAKWNSFSSEDGDWSGLHIAANAGQEEVARAMIRGGADINAKSVAGETALDVAHRTNHLKVANLLQAHGGVRGSER